MAIATMTFWKLIRSVRGKWYGIELSLKLQIHGVIVISVIAWVQWTKYCRLIIFKTISNDLILVEHFKGEDIQDFLLIYCIVFIITVCVYLKY